MRLTRSDWRSSSVVRRTRRRTTSWTPMGRLPSWDFYGIVVKWTWVLGMWWSDILLTEMWSFLTVSQRCTGWVWWVIEYVYWTIILFDWTYPAPPRTTRTLTGMRWTCTSHRVYWPSRNWWRWWWCRKTSSHRTSRLLAWGLYKTVYWAATG